MESNTLLPARRARPEVARDRDGRASRKSRSCNKIWRELSSGAVRAMKGVVIADKTRLMCVCVCVCVCMREGESARARGRERERKKKITIRIVTRHAVCARLCLSVCVYIYDEWGRDHRQHRTDNCIVLQCVRMCCSVLQCVAVCCSVLQCVSVCCSVLQCVAVYCRVCYSVLQCVAVCCSMLHLEL